MSPRAYWKCEANFNNGVGVPNGTSVDSPTFVTGQVGNAASFDGSNDGAYLYPANTANGWEVPGSFTCTGLAWDAGANGFWIGDYTNSQVKLVDALGVLQTTLSVGFQPQGIAVDADGLHLWVCNYSGNSVRKILKSDGSTVTSLAMGWAPNGVTINGSDNLLVTRDLNSTLYEFTKAGASVGTVSLTESGTAIVTAGYTSPDGIHWVDSSTLYVILDGTSKQDSLGVFDPSTGVMSSRVGVQDSPEGVTVKDGDIWVCVDDEFHRSVPRGNRVEKWSLSRPSVSFGGWFKSSSMASTVAMLVNGCPINTNPATGLQIDRRGVGLYGLTGAGSVRLLINDGSGTASLSKDVTVSLSTWKHIVVTIDGPNQEAKIYVGGVAQGSPLSLSGMTAGISFSRFKNRWGLANSPDGDVVRFANMQADEVFFEEAVLDSTTINAYALGFGNRRRRLLIAG